MWWRLFEEVEKSNGSDSRLISSICSMNIEALIPGKKNPDGLADQAGKVP